MSTSKQAKRHVVHVSLSLFYGTVQTLLMLIYWAAAERYIAV